MVRENSLTVPDADRERIIGETEKGLRDPRYARMAVNMLVQYMETGMPELIFDAPPPTREGFDRMYAKLAKQGLNQKEVLAKAIRNSALTTDEALNTHARELASYSKNPDLLQAVDIAAKKLRLPLGTVEAMWSASGQYDTNHFDPRLTAEERKFVENVAALVRHGRSKGYYASTANEAPDDSPWANQIKAQEATKRGQRQQG